MKTDMKISISPLLFLIDKSRTDLEQVPKVMKHRLKNSV